MRISPKYLGDKKGEQRTPLSISVPTHVENFQKWIKSCNFKVKRIQLSSKAVELAQNCVWNWLSKVVNH